MKLSVKNLGPIDQGEMELGKLTLICGGNNSGKTYLAYSIYGILRYCHGRVSLNGLKETHPVLTLDRVKELLSHGFLKVEVDMAGLLAYDTMIFNHICATFEKDLPVWFEGYEAEFENTGVSFVFDEEIVKKRIETSLAAISDEPVHAASMEFDNGTLTFSAKPDARILEDPAELNSFLKRMISDFNNTVFRQVEWEPFIITSERMGISLFYRELDAHRSELLEYVRNGKNQEGKMDVVKVLSSNSSRYAKPISQEIVFARELDHLAKKQSPLAKDNNFHGWIEKMMGGRYETDEFGTNFLSLPGAERQFDIPLHRASASVRELSHLYHYLRHVASQGDLLVIDEPESHLSSANQVLLVRMLSECINAGLRVLLTTHSEIILREINTLIMLHQLEGEQRDIVNTQRVHYAGLMGIHYSAVSAYYCNERTIVRSEVDDTGVVMPPMDETLMNMDEDVLIIGSLIDGDYEDD